jgi:hypothetical protein
MAAPSYTPSLEEFDAVLARRRLVAYQDDPVAYAHDRLGLRLTPDQEEILDSVRQNRRTIAKASHAVGKTFIAAAASCWWYDCWDEHIVYITAPTWKQALGLTFKQIKRFRLNLGLPGDVLDSGLVRDPDRLREPAHFIKAINAESGEGFQGEHSAPILIVMEEAVGVPPYIWEATDGLMTSPECRTLCIGNPTDEATQFGQACATPLYHVLTICALEHPNILAELAAQPPPFPAAVRLQWLREMLEKECQPADTREGDCFAFYDLETLDRALMGIPVPADAPKVHYLPTASFQGRVLGEFPTQADEQVIPRGWINALPLLDAEDNPPEVGCDVARHGSDRTTIATRRGPRVLSLKALRQMDNVAVTEALREAARQAAADFPVEPKQVKIRIDVTGGLGTGPYDFLKAEGYAVAAVNASATPADKEQFINRRSEMWFTMRERVRTKRLDLSPLPKEVRRDLEREFATPKYKVDGHGKKVVEPKDQIKKRLGESPDLADAVNLAFTDMGRWWQDNSLKAWMKARAGGETEAKPEEPKPTGMLGLAREQKEEGA